MGIGIRHTFSQQSTLYELVNDYGVGVMSGDFAAEPPAEVFDFSFSQFDRFGITRPPDDVVWAAAKAMYYVIDIGDPYALLCGASDVEVTDWWQHFAYEILEDNGTITEANPEHLETFEFMPNQDTREFEKLLAHPGLDALPFVSELFDDALTEGELGAVSEETMAWLRDECAGSDEKYQAYFRLPAWATFLWFAGPLGRQFRRENHDVFYLAARDGEAVLYDGCFLGKEHYRRLPRPVQSCFVCGLDSWCVELAHIAGTPRYLCEKHLNGALPLYGRANCGSRFCKYAECPHHPEHGRADAMHRILSGHGQLSQLTQQMGSLSGTQRVKLLK